MKIRRSTIVCLAILAIAGGWAWRYNYITHRWMEANLCWERLYLRELVKYSAVQQLHLTNGAPITIEQLENANPNWKWTCHRDGIITLGAVGVPIECSVHGSFTNKKYMFSHIFEPRSKMGAHLADIHPGVPVH